jgi:5-methylcytosine-specific restriction endonuclease McrA
MSKAYYQSNRQSLLLKKREYDALHKEQISRNGRLYYERNRERIKENSNKYHHSHKSIANARTRKWHEEHPVESKAAKCFSRAKRRAIEYATGIDTYGIHQWMKEIKTKPFVRCHWCGTKIHGMQVVFDHIIPLSKKGTHTIGNLCASCRDCNSSKKDRMPSKWSRNGQSFLSL